MSATRSIQHALPRQKQPKLGHAQITRSPGISPKTVQNHVSHILDKVQAADQTQAFRRVGQPT
jgi:DNA-binding NarL/FixJ family response regulator